MDKWKKKGISCIVLLFAFLGCVGISADRKHVVFDEMGVPLDSSPYPEEFNWQKKGPIDFLEFLQSRGGYTVWGIHKGWIKESDIPELIGLLDSDDSCGDVAMSISSFHHSGRSTVGREAAFLIHGFRIGRYPPNLNSIRFEFDKNEILDWWAKYDPKGAT